MRRYSQLTLLTGLIGGLTVAGRAEAQDTIQNDRFLVLRMQTPGEGSIQYEHGWPLRFSIRPRDDASFEFYNREGQQFPGPGDNAALILRRSQCSSIINPEVCSPNDWERFMAFTVDTDTPGVPDSEGYRNFRFGTIFDRTEYRPIYRYGTDPTDPSSVEEIRLGPSMPDNEADGIGYGPNDDLPGFVLLSNIGVGRVLTASTSFDGSAQPLELQTPLKARNLAGLMTDVSLELRAKPDRSVVHVGMTVPPELFAPIVLWDSCVNEGTPANRYECPGRIRYHIDGGPAIYSESFFDNGPFFVGDPDVTVVAPPNVVEVELTALVVQGDAPAFVDDCNGDGEINRRDLRCMGYTVISNQVKKTFIQARVHVTCDFNTRVGAWPGPGVQALEVDFDGFDFDPEVLCPTTPGRVSRPPN